MFMMNKLYFNDSCLAAFFCYLRAFFISVNECVIFIVVFCSNIGEDRAIGLIVNFGAALIICELDDIIMSTGRIQYWREVYDNMEDESGDADDKPSSKDEEANEAAAGEKTKLVETTPPSLPAYKILGDRKYSHCGFMKVMVPKNNSVGDNLFICFPYYLGFAFIGTCMKKFVDTFSCLKNFSIGFNVGTFHRLFAFAGFFYLIDSDFRRFDPKEFGNGALRSGGVLTASSSWVPSYTVENSILREFIIETKYT